MNDKSRERTVSYTDLCRYDNAFKYAVDVVVYSDEFILGNKGDRLQFAVSEYGFNRLLKDSLDGLIDIRESSLIAQALYYPKITEKYLDKELARKKALLIESFKKGEPLPEEIRRMIHDENDTI